ncbi:MAG TPA: hypothetical protein DEB39_04435 [Planctomycetaceae bacterium]|nr:hypothetical protein [Planctomycetaceae bacterium]
MPKEESTKRPAASSFGIGTWIYNWKTSKRGKDFSDFPVFFPKSQLRKEGNEWIHLFLKEEKLQ